MATLKRFFKDEQGLETIEYAVMTALIVAAMLPAIRIVADQCGDLGGFTQRINDLERLVEMLATSRTEESK